MRKIIPKYLLQMRDPIAVIKDGKILANMAAYTLEGELERSEYNLPRFTSVEADIGNLTSSLNMQELNGSLILDNGRTADAYKRSGSYGDVKLRLKNGNRNFFSHGLDNSLPKLYTQKSGDKAGRKIVRHPSAGYMDCTNEVVPSVMEVKTVLDPTSHGTAPNNHLHHLTNACIVDESDTTLFHWASRTDYRTGNSSSSATVFPLQKTDKDITKRSSWNEFTHSAPMLVGYNKMRRVLFSTLPTAPGSTYPGGGNYGEGPSELRFIASRIPVAGEALSPQIRSDFALVLDRFLSSAETFMRFSSNENAGYRRLPVVRAVQETNTSSVFYAPVILSRMISGRSQYTESVKFHRCEFNHESSQWTHTEINPQDADGNVVYFEEEQITFGPKSWSDYSVSGESLTVHYDISYVHEIDGTTYLFALSVPSGDAARVLPSLTLNTMQYVFRLDPVDPAKMVLVHKEVMPGFFGMASEGVCSFASNKEQTRLYVIGQEAVYRLKLDVSLKRYVLDDLVYGVNATSIAVTDNEDLWMVSVDQKLYGLRADNSDIVRVQFADNTSNVFDEAPFDVEVRVSAVDHLGARGSKSVELVVDGNAVFKANNRNKITVQTSADADVTALITVRDFGQIYVTPSKIE